MEVLLFLFLLIFLLLIGMPIGFVLIFVGSLGILYEVGFQSLQGILSTTAFSSVSSFTYSAIPLFILMALLISKSGIVDELFDAILKWIGHIPGGPAITTIFASAGFGTMSGSSVAATSVMAQVAVPQMIKAGYSKSLSTGLVASSTGTLAVMIPPSVPLILYAIQTENSVGKLLIAGILPGLFLALLLCIYVSIVSIRQKTKTQTYSWTERFQSIKNIWPIVLLVLCVMAVIYFGIGTATEAAAFGALGALILGLVLKRLSYKNIYEALLATLKSSTMIFTIILGAHILTYYITITRVGNQIIEYIQNTGLSSGMILLLIVIIYLILGCFLDMIGTMLLTLPLVYPLILSLGFDPIWFGVFLVLLLEIGLITPPVGISLFVTSEQSGISLEEVLKGSIPFLFLLLFCLFLFWLFPDIILYLPSKM
jgi:C4-dicarboxylate transporter, DctM subunit